MKKKKRVLIAGIDECDMVENEIEYRAENLGEHEDLLKNVMDKVLDSSLPEHAKYITLYEAGNYSDLLGEIKKDAELLKQIKSKLSDDIWQDYDWFQMYFDDEVRLVDEEFKESPYCGYYMDNHGDAKYYKDGKSLLYEVTRRHQTNDFEMYRESDGTILIKVGSYSYEYKPVERRYDSWIGKYVIYGELDIYKITGFSSYDGPDHGDVANLEALKYDPEGRRLTTDACTIGEGSLMTEIRDGRTNVRLLNVSDAMHLYRINSRMYKFMELGVS